MDKFNNDNRQITIRNPFNGRNTIIELWAEPIGQFTVRAGASSDYSYTGAIEGCTTLEQVETIINERHNSGLIFKK